MGALGLVDAQEVDLAALVAELDAQVVAVDGAGPVGDAVRVDLAAEDADRGGVAVVGRGPDGAAVGRDSRGRRRGAEENLKEGSAAHGEGMECLDG